MQLGTKSFIAHCCGFVQNTVRRSNNRDCSHCLWGSDTSTRTGSCVDFCEHEPQSELQHGREREGEGMSGRVISNRPHFQQNTAIFTVSAPTDHLWWPSDGRKTDELRYLASGGCFSSTPRQTRFLPSSLFHVTCFEHFKTTDTETILLYGSTFPMLRTPFFLKIILELLRRLDRQHFSVRAVAKQHQHHLAYFRMNASDFFWALYSHANLILLLFERF